MKRKINYLLLTVLVATLAMTLLSAGKAYAAAIEFPATTFKIKMLGDLTLVAKDGAPQALVVRDRELAAADVYVTINGVPYSAYVLLGVNLNLLPGTSPLIFEHDGTIDLTIGSDTISLEYTGSATKMKDMATHVKTLNSHGDFVITKGTGPFADLEGVKGGYMLTLVCSGEGHPMVGSPVEVTLSARAQ